MVEMWKEIPQRFGFQASSLGRIRSRWEKVRHQRGCLQRELADVFGLDQSTISYICSRKHFARVR